MPDTMSIEILSDGTIKVTTDPISAANHANADAFLKCIAQLAGGEVTREKRPDRHHAHQDHGHHHEHD